MRGARSSRSAYVAASVLVGAAAVGVGNGAGQRIWAGPEGSA